MDPKWGVRQGSARGDSGPLCRDGFINLDGGVSHPSLLRDLAPGRCWAGGPQGRLERAFLGLS